MRIVFYFVWICLLTVLQPTLVRGIDIFGIAPNMFLCFVVIAGLFRGKKEGAICGAVSGLIYDILIGRMLGISSLCYLYLGFGTGILSEHFFGRGKRLAGLIGAFAGTIFVGLIYYIAISISYGGVSFLTAFFRTILIEALYNAGIGFLISYPIEFTMKLLKIQRIS